MYVSTITPAPIFDRTLTLLESLTTISSPSGDRAGLERCAHTLAEALESVGMTTALEDRTDADGASQPVLTAYRGKTLPDRCLFLIGHTDTVLPAVSPTHRDGRLHATGAIDMKGGLAAFVGALGLLRTRGVSPPDDLLLVVVPDEEVAGHLSHWAVSTYGPEARALWVLEPGQRFGEDESLVAGRRGMVQWRLDVTGRGAHAGNGYWQGRSALDAAAAWCIAAREQARPGSGPTVNTGRMVAGDRDFVDRLAEHTDLLGTQRRINVVPDRARVEGEARFLTRADGETLVGALEDAATRIAQEREVTMRFATHAEVAPVDPRGPGRDASERAVGLATDRGWSLVLEEDRGGISFSNFLPEAGTVPILDGLGPVGDGMHTRDEFVELASLDRRITLLADLLAEDARGRAQNRQT